MIDITRNDKFVLSVNSPILLASGVAGFGGQYPPELLALERIGALITNPVTYQAWSPVRGTRVVGLDAGVLVHTGLPNLGLERVVKEYARAWRALPTQIILHLVATQRADLQRSADLINRTEGIAGLELGLNDDIGIEKAVELVQAVRESIEKPFLVRLPMLDAYEIAEACADAGAGALVVCAPPRGTARDPHSKRLVQGRVYGALLKPMILRMVGVLRRRIDNSVPIIGAGGIHNPQDARDYLDAGAVAVQLDSLLWIQPKLVERIARDVTGGLVTRPYDALADEWHPDMGDTEALLQEESDEPPQETRAMR
jgi:dihydroorotate dehydrogenase (NAD+) catalytic subunit